MMRGLALVFLTLSLFSVAAASVSTGAAHSHLRVAASSTAVETPSPDVSMKAKIVTLYERMRVTLDGGIHKVAEHLPTVNLFGHKQAPAEEEASPTHVFASTVATAIIQVPFAILAVFIYKKTMTEVREAGKVDGAKYEFEKGFTAHHFDVFGDVKLFACSFFCPCVVWADSIALMAEATFWAAFAAFMLVWVVNISMGGIWLWLLYGVVLTYSRMKIRTKFGMPNGNGERALDCALFCCCSPCAITQEAILMRDAIKVKGVKDVEGALTGKGIAFE